jgi:Right handed beta helix region
MRLSVRVREQHRHGGDFLFFKEAQFMNKALGAVFGFVGAILLFLPTAAQAGPLLVGEPIGTQIFCTGTQSNPNLRAITISANLGRVQPLRVHAGKGGAACSETISISDTRVNVTIIGDGGDVLRNGDACSDGNNTQIIGEDPSQSQIIQIRGKNITITGVEISGQSINDVSGKVLSNLSLFDGIDFDSAQCTSDSPSDPNCNNSRGIRGQRGGIFLIGRNQALGSFNPKLVNDSDNHNPKQYEERTGVCIHDVGKAGIEVTQGSLARIINSSVHHVGGDGVAISETSHATVGFSSGGEFGLTNDPFPGPGHAGPNFLHNNTGNAVSVTRNSYARIVGNTLFGNVGNGVSVTRGSGADVADNVIGANTGRGIDINDNSQVNLGTTGDPRCNLTPKTNIVPGGGLGGTQPTAAGTQCPGTDSGTTQNSGETTSGVVNLGNLANTVLPTANTAGGIRCQRSYVAGRWLVDRTNGAASLGNNAGSSFTTCTSTLN